MRWASPSAARAAVCRKPERGSSPPGPKLEDMLAGDFNVVQRLRCLQLEIMVEDALLQPQARHRDPKLTRTKNDIDVETGLPLSLTAALLSAQSHAASPIDEAEA